MSKLIDRLHRISQGASQSIGFRAGAAAPRQAMLLVAVFHAVDIAAIKEAIGEVDALVVSWEGEREEVSCAGQVSEVAQAISWGGWCSRLTEEGVKKLQKAGADFLVFEAGTPAAVVRGQEMGKILRVDPTWSDNFIRTLEQLPVDAVLLDEREETMLTLLQLMQCRRLISLAAKPLLVATPPGLKKEDIESLWEAGVSGVVVEVGKDGAERVREWRQVIKALPATTRWQRKKAEPLLPTLASPPPAKEEEEGEEE